MKRLVNFRVAVFLTTAIILGIQFSYCCLFGNIFGAVAAVVAALAAFIVFIFFSTANFKSTGKFLCFLIFIATFAFGGISFKITVDNYQNADLSGHIVSTSGRIEEISDKENYSALIVGGVKFSGIIDGDTKYKIALYVYGDNDFKIGDVISFKTAIKDRTLFYNGKFSAAALSENVRYYSDIGADEIEITAHTSNVFEVCNDYIYNVLKAGLSEDEFGIAYAMLTGNSDYISEENLASFRAAGVAHIFAVSGLHIGFLATAVYFVLNKIKFKNYLSFLLTFLLCLFYSGVCGFSASSIRAVIMFFVLNFAKILGLKYDAVSSVFLAAFIILLISPVQMFCIGFLLSFSVVFTIIALYNPMMKLLKFMPKKLAAAVSVSLSAEVGGAPVILFFFGNFASLSMFINILFIPIAAAIFVALFLGVLLGGVFSPVVCLFVQNYALFGLNFVINSLDFRIFLVGGFTLGGFAAAYYGTIIIAAGFINIKKAVKTTLCVLLSVITATGTCTVSAIQNEKTYAYVLGSENLSAALITFDEQNLLIISDISYRTFSERRLAETLSEARGEAIFVVLLKQTEYVDLAAMTVKIRATAKNAGLIVNRLYYYGEEDKDAENVLGKLFSRFTVVNVADGENVSVFGGTFEFAAQGRCLIFKRKGYNTGVFATLKGDEIVEYPDCCFNTVICLDNHEKTELTLSPERTVSFRPKSGYLDGETEGRLAIQLG